MREIDICAIMNQLGFSASQMEKWQSIQQKLMKPSPVFAGAPIVNMPTSPMIHKADVLAEIEPIVV